MVTMVAIAELVGRFNACGLRAAFFFAQTASASMKQQIQVRISLISCSYAVLIFWALYNIAAKGTFSLAKERCWDSQ